ncbi:hypothetical protein TIFTF001_013368 [Ficus carica]|uniref:t-SNARE coiled-coil homology domain-containing protein n=1 Tax=Ficus carica TaxID=3494 RepID=A0AA88D2T8_FICCA|nr:hypothetical protein TIFTF001_013368 [Ficus carica]
MSFQDVEAGRSGLSGQRLKLKQQDSSESSLASSIFQINTAVSSFHRLVNSLGTPKDTLQLRDNLHRTRLRIGQLVKDTSSKLRQASEIDHHAEISTAKKIADAKLAKDFQSVLKEFQKAQRTAAERETAYAPYVPKEVLPSSYSVHEQEISLSRNHEEQILLLESKREEVLLLDNEIVFNEAIIEEREQGIQEIQQQIGEVNEIFKDLAVLDMSILTLHNVKNVMILDDIGSHIANSHAATTQATTQLSKASKLQKSSSSLSSIRDLSWSRIKSSFKHLAPDKAVLSNLVPQQNDELNGISNVESIGGG